MKSKLGCIEAYELCLDHASKGLDSCVRACSGFQKHGKFADYNACVDNCQTIANLDMAICATRFATCGLKRLLSPPLFGDDSE